ILETLNYSIVWTDRAISDLNRIFLFLSSKSEIAAAKTVDKIHKKVSTLEKGFSKIGQREPLLGRYPEEYRYLVSGNYKIIYSSAKKKIYNNSIFDVQQNPKKLKVKK